VSTCIAVIDDDLTFVELMRDLLADGEGYDVVSTTNWLESHDFVKRQRPDLVILDLMLGGGQSGWRVLERLREDPSTATIPVILCSAAVPALAHRPTTLAAFGPLVTVAKPFEVEQLLHVISELLASEPLAADGSRARIV
jgi:CheY-like chemotaxis protein